MTPSLCCIILSWNAAPYLTRCIESFRDAFVREGIDYTFHVVDNGSTDGSVAEIKSYLFQFPEYFSATFFHENRGTTASRNEALRRSAGTHVAFLDADTAFLDGSIKDILMVLDRRADIGIIAPQLLCADGSVQPSVKRFPTMLQKLAKLPGMLLGGSPAQRDFYAPADLTRPFWAETAISAAWFFRRDLVEAIGFLDEAIFYSPEDLDYCVRSWKHGKKILYYPAVRVRHFTQQLSHKSPFSRLAGSHLSGLLHYYRKHGGWISTGHLRQWLPRERDAVDPAGDVK